MQTYADKDALIIEIRKRADLFINEFSDVLEGEKDIYKTGIDRTPAQMIAYQLGWLNLIQSWEKDNKNNKSVVTPSPNYKWNNLGGLYQEFYQTYSNYTLEQLIDQFNKEVDSMIDLINSLDNKTLFESDKRQWASSTPSKWPVWKWIHINTVAPFKTFRTKIKKWKKTELDR
ncbi:ClbS/DfsB family four-helix bundle protein [Staphylococcus taiwanensis]|nr:ClbS/DfsB family four-helix bundle protein [Staphylococcus taiwanensis]